MKTIIRSLRRSFVFLAAVLGAFSIALLGFSAPAWAADPLLPGPAPIEQRSSTTMTSDNLPTVQIDSGVVWAQEIIGNIVYAGGAFTNARPAGAEPGTSLIPRSNMLAYNITTGIITSFAPQINGTVKSIKASPDGTRLYVGGSFNKVNGQTRWNLAAFDVATGALLSTFSPTVGGSYVNAIAVTNSAVYVGGLIGAGNGVTRKNLAAFNTSGALLGWAPTTDLQVDALTLTAAKDKLIVGGRFGMTNGVVQRGLAALDPSNGALLPWDAPNTVKNGMSSGSSAGKAGIWGLTSDQNAVYGTGWVYADVTVGNLEGTFAAESGSGKIVWIADCHGDHYGVYSDGTNVYTTSHEHACESAGGIADKRPENTRNATATTAAAKGTLARSPWVNSIYKDWSGYPAPALINWYPNWLIGSATGMGQAGFSVVGTGKYLAIGGEFIGVNNQRQQGLVRFSSAPPGGAKQGPRLSGSSWTPVAKSVAAGSARVTIGSNWDRDDLFLKYSLMRVGTAQPVATTTAQATFWNLGSVTLTDTGLSPGSSQSYYVVASDADGNSVSSPQVSVQISNATASPYINGVLNDNPLLFWPLGGAAATAAADWAGSNNGTVGTGVGTTATGGGAISGDSAPASTFNGTANGVVGTTATAAVGSTFSTEVWFKTTTTSGGKLMGYGSSSSGSSSNYDRHVYMLNNGRLTFGTYTGATKTVASTSSYNDGAWHHVVATQGPAGMVLYVDGVMVGSDPQTTTAQSYLGYWRIGGDNLSGWPNAPTSSYFNGSLDNFAVYSTVLTASQVASHFALGTGQGVPTASFTATVNNLAVAVDATGSSAPAGQTISSYQWDFGDGSALGTGVRANHSYATAGNFTVVLTVKTAAGVPASTSKTVSTSSPNVAPVAAFNAAMSGLVVSVDGSAATDADGSVASYAWQFGDGSTGTGKTAMHTYAAAGSYTVRLVVTDNQGLASAAVTKPVTAIAVPVNALAQDAFGRTVTNGWGTADTGGAWSLTGSAAMFQVSGGVAKMPLLAGSTRFATLGSVSSTSSDSRATVALNTVPTGGGDYVSIVGRRVDPSSYSMKVWVKADGSVWLVLLRDSTTLTLVRAPGLSYSANMVLNVRLQVTGTSPTTVQAKIWQSGQSEPTAWLSSVTDNTAALQTAGSVGLGSYLSGSATSAVTTSFDDYSVTTVAAAANNAPLAQPFLADPVAPAAKAAPAVVPAPATVVVPAPDAPTAPAVKTAPAVVPAPAAPAAPTVKSAPAVVPAPALPAVPAVKAVPTPDHAVVVVMGNHSSESIVGNPEAPFINSLAEGGASMTASFAVADRSQPNYLALFSGATQGRSDDSCPNSYTSTNIASQLLEAGKTFAGFSEDLPNSGFTGCQSGAYVRAHSPWTNWPSIAETASAPMSAFPTDYSKLPTLSYVIPSLEHDMHDGTIAEGDAWLKENLGAYATWAKQHNSLLIITWDEGRAAGNNQIPTIITGQKVVPGEYTEKITHYNVLRTLQDAFGLPANDGSKAVLPLTDIWNN